MNARAGSLAAVAALADSTCKIKKKQNNNLVLAQKINSEKRQDKERLVKPAIYFMHKGWLAKGNLSACTRKHVRVRASAYVHGKCT